MNAQPNASLHASGSQSVFVEFEKFQSYEFDLVCHHSVTHHNFSLSKGDNLKSKLFQLLVFSALMYMGLCLINWSLMLPQLEADVITVCYCWDICTKTALATIFGWYNHLTLCWMPTGFIFWHVMSSQWLGCHWHGKPSSGEWMLICMAILSSGFLSISFISTLLALPFSVETLGCTPIQAKIWYPYVVESCGVRCRSISRIQHANHHVFPI
jgi:hypothetical protein